MLIYPSSRSNAANLETSSGRVDLSRIKAELKDVETASSWYFDRNAWADDWFDSRWDGQTNDGRKWSINKDNDSIFPWPGASDTRVRLSRMLLNEYRTICMHALMNMKVQAKSTRPAATVRESQQVTTLLNYQIFTQMHEEWHRETELVIANGGRYGSGIMSVDWEQERRLETITINTMQFGQWLGFLTGQQFQPTDVADMLADESYEKDLIVFIQEMSEILTTAKARSILKDLRELRTADVPVPYTFKNKPRIMSLRPFVDVFFNPMADDLQRERWVDRLEPVTETILNDRVETDGYDPGFVKQASKLKGTVPNDALMEYGWRGGGGTSRVYPGGKGNPDNTDQGKLIWLNHFYHYKLDMGVPCLYDTVFHMDLDDYAYSAPIEYNHGQMPFHAFRFETDHRPILSSQGIPEITHTWENELKAQFDGRTDRVSLTLAPPMFSPHSEVLKLKKAWHPTAIIPMGHGNREPKFSPVPPYDPGSIQISEDIMRRVDRYFGWFGNEVDPQLKQMRQMQLVDRTTTQFTPVVRQILKLDQQFMDDEEVAMICGGHIHTSREQIQGEYQITAVCDLRDNDTAFLKEKLGYLAQLKAMDTGGVMDSNKLVRLGLEAVDYTFADEIVQDTQQATNKEITEEISTLNRIIGSGMPEPLPQGGNYQLRLQVMKNHLSTQDPEFPNPNLQRPDVRKVLENRQQFFERQLQQQQNAMIGRTQVANPFTGGAPQLSQGSGGGY